MGTIYLFGSNTVFGIPAEIVGWLRAYVEQGHSFILGDKKGVDESFHRALSSVGAHNVTIYSMGDVKNNKYGFNVKKYNTFFDEEEKKAYIVADDNEEETFEINNIAQEIDIPVNRNWREFKERQMVKDCDMAICIWDGETKNTLETVKLLGIYDKPCHMVKTVK